MYKHLTGRFNYVYTKCVRLAGIDLDDQGAVGIADAFADGSWPMLKVLRYVCLMQNEGSLL